MTRIVKEDSSAEMTVRPVYPVVVKDIFSVRALVPYLPMLGMSVMDEHRVRFIS